jgi:hypothetical protein
VSVDDLLYEPISRALRIGTIVVDGTGKRMKVVEVGSIDSDYLTCAYPDDNGHEVRENFWKSSIKVIEG